MIPDPVEPAVETVEPHRRDIGHSNLRGDHVRQRSNIPRARAIGRHDASLVGLAESAIVSRWRRQRPLRINVEDL
jgi:hypothetical protein